MSELKTQSWFKKLLPYILAILAFIIIGYSYAPYTLQGKVVNQSDISSWNGMANEIVTWNDAHPGDRTLWTNSMFSGMPATTISVKYHGDFTQYLYDILFIGQRPASYLIICMIGAFLMFLAFGVNIWLAILGAIAMAFCSYNMQIIQVGHNSKMVAIAFMPWVIASLVYAYKKNWIWGAIFFAFTLSFQIKANHPQITYYLAIIVLGFIIWQLCDALKGKTFSKFFKISIAILIAGLLGIATNINHLWPTYEYAKHTMRGGTELTENTASQAQTGGAMEDKILSGNKKENAKSRSGLDLSYATQWSYGINETPNLFIPNFNGGSSAGSLSQKSETYKLLSQSYQGADQVIQQMPTYWGPQSFTAGPMYMGAICIFLFLLGFFVLKGGLKWWVGGVSILALMLSWGSHFMGLTEFFFNYAPLYNKFRTVSMILVILQVMIPILAVLAANEMLNGNIKKEEAKKGMMWALGITGGFALLFSIFPSLAGNFTSQSDSQLPKEIAASLAQDRISLLRADAFRSLVFVVLAAAALWYGFTKKLKAKHATLALIVLVIIDMWGVDKRYLGSKDFVSQQDFTSVLNKRPVDEMILSDKSPDYRVLDLSVDPFNNAYTSYWHKTIGGYSPAKLQRYQDLIERDIMPEIQGLAKELDSAKTIADANAAITYHPVLSMLNTRYIILNAQTPPLINNFALGNCWFVNNIVPAQDANDEMAKLQTIDPHTTAVISNDFLDKDAQLKQITAAPKDTAAGFSSIALTSYAPNKLTYHYSSKAPKIALFSEVYYNPGWTAKLKNPSGEKELNIFRANWILRGVVLPAGEGDITFFFEPESFTKGELYSEIASGILILLLIGGIVCSIRKKRKLAQVAD
ncbi:MAG: YfhO family protein [Bacteroidales bacterium]|jgi:hypothetical protein|nr:YfhO family protein [Bacteroidales bacterium]